MNAHRITQTLGPFLEERPTFKRKDRAIDALQINRHHLGVSLPCHEFEAFSQLIEHAMTGDLTFREKTYDLTFLQSCCDTADGVFGPSCRNGNGADNAQEPCEPLDVIKHVPHDKAHLPVTGSSDQQRIDVTHVIWQQKHAATFRHLR